MDPPKAACAEGTLKVKIGETIRALCSALVWKRGVGHGTGIVYALATLAAFACALCGDRTAVLEVCMGGYGKGEVLNMLLVGERLWRFLVAVSEMAEFVCHTPDHNLGIQRRGREGEEREKKGNIKCVSGFALALFLAQTWPAFPVQV
jgi:hypothetical protein